MVGIDLIFKVLAPFFGFLVGIWFYRISAWKGVYSESLLDRESLVRKKNLALGDHCAELARRLKMDLEIHAPPKELDKQVLTELRTESFDIWKMSRFCSPEVKVVADSFSSLLGLVENDYDRGLIALKDHQIKVVCYYYLIEIIDYSFSTYIPRKPSLFFPKIDFKKEISGYSYGRYLTIEDMKYKDLFSKGSNHVFVSLYHSVSARFDPDFLLSKYFVQSVHNRNEFFLVYMILSKIAFPYRIDGAGGPFLAYLMDYNDGLSDMKDLGGQSVDVFYFQDVKSGFGSDRALEALSMAVSHLQPQGVVSVDHALNTYKVTFSADQLRSNFKYKHKTLRFLIHGDQGKGITSSLFLELRRIFGWPYRVVRKASVFCVRKFSSRRRL